MKYFSTRGGEQILSFEEAVVTGLAPDGGLYIPLEIPSLPPDWQSAWRNYTFQQLSVALLSLYISPEELSKNDLESLVQKAYQSFRHPEITPLHKLHDRLYLLELFHGPTYAFKDVALQLLGNLFEFFLKRKNAAKSADEPKEKLTIVGATSGDTGSAAIYGLRNKDNISIFILHPKGRVSPIQEAQMTSVADANVHNIAVKGTFDDCQDIVKSLFADTEFNATHRLAAVNSINWARILAQTVYYFLAYFHAIKQLPPDADLQFVVPTGNFGDILAGYYAKRMGLPMGKLVVATNENDILARFWKTGLYEKVENHGGEGATAPADGASDGKQAVSGVKETWSPAMDILVSSNFERLLWYLAFETQSTSNGVDDRRVQTSRILRDWMSQVKSNGRVQVPTQVLEFARRDFVAERVSDEETLEAIRTTYSKFSYIADPHTSVGLSAAQAIAPSNPSTTMQIVLSTAHPAKFSEAVSQAIPDSPQFNFDRDVLPEEFRGLLDKQKRVIDVDGPDINLVKAVIERYVPSARDGVANASV